MIKSTFRYLLVWALCLFGSGYALAAPVAYVHELTGNMQLQYGTRAPQGLKIGDTVDSGATLITGAGSNAVVKFEDGQIVALQPDTRFAVRQYQFVKTNVAKSNSALELLAGGLRFVTGMIGATNRDAFKFTAGTATIGIRGTDGSAFLNQATGEVSAATNSGTLTISNSRGTSVIPVGNFVTAPRNAAPPPAAPIARAPAALVQAITRARAITMPPNTAVSVLVSARAAGSEARAAAAERAVQAATTEPERQAAQREAEQARAAAATDAQAASQASQQTTQDAVRGGAVMPAAPAPAAPGATALTPAAPTSTAATIEALPPTAAGQPLTTPGQQPTVTTTPTSTGGGAGGGVPASGR